MMEIDADRLRTSFDDYAAIGATENGGLHRLALTDEDRAARDQLVADAEELGLDVRVDGIGNVFARRAGTDPDAAPVLIGSHLDSQPYGGRFDGQLGVLVALEALRSMADEGVETRRPIELVNWTNEEGSRYQHAMLGSAVFTGATSLSEARSLTDDDGLSVGEELERIGYDGSDSVDIDGVHANLELHVEQGPTLEAHGKRVGVVDGVFGMAWLNATVHGDSDHAGPSPMHTRRDALVAATEAIGGIRALPNRLSADAVATVGRLRVEPDSINVIPDLAEFTIDVRSYDDDVVDRAVEAAEFELRTACEREGTTYDLEEIWHIPHTEFSPRVRDALSGAAADHDVAFEHVKSGAGHDAKYLNDVTDSGMLFVPSVDGKTHNEAEFTRWEDVVAGANVFATAAATLANQPVSDRNAGS